MNHSSKKVIADENATAASPLMPGEKHLATGIKTGDVSRYVLFAGDPKRSDHCESIWDSYQEVSYNREYRNCRGTFQGTDISIVSTGIGDLAMSFAVEEIARSGADTFIRVGTTGALQPEIECGSLIINTGMIRGDGTSKCYIQPEYPALANYEVVMALIDACETLGYKYYVGIGASADSFYAGQARPCFNNYWQSAWDNMVEDYRRAGIVNWEGEASALLTLSSLFGLRAGFISTVIDNRITNEFNHIGEPESVHAASLAVVYLARWDQMKAEKGVKYVTPSMFK
ncbi:MAG: nucleoside phosphorylase [Anaerolineaceae bacterium]